TRNHSGALRLGHRERADTGERVETERRRIDQTGQPGVAPRGERAEFVLRCQPRGDFVESRTTFEAGIAARIGIEREQREKLVGERRDRLRRATRIKERFSFFYG